MVTYTTNHQFQLFGDNEEPWEHRSDFQKLDTLLQSMSADGTEVSGLQSLGVEELNIPGWNIVDLVSAGADPTGTVDAGPVIRNNIADNTLLVFPTGGRFLVDSAITLQGWNNVGFWSPRRATIVAGPNLTAKTFTMGNLTPGEGLLFKNLNIDASQNPPIGQFSLLCNDRLFMENVAILGQTYNVAQLTAGVTSDSGYGQLKNVNLPDGGVWPSTNNRQDGAMGMFIKAEHTGEIHIDGCHVEGFPDNGLRSTEAVNGNVIVRGGLFKNNNFSNIRDNGHVTIGAEIEIDNPDPAFPECNGIYTGGDGSRHIRPKIKMDTAAGGDGIRVTGEVESCVIEQPVIRINDFGGNPIRLAGYSGTLRKRGVTINNATIFGNATSTTSNKEAIRDNRGEDVVINDPYIDLYNQSFIGIGGSGSSRRINGGSIRVGDHPILPGSGDVISDVQKISSTNRRHITCVGPDVQISNMHPSITTVKGDVRTKWDNVIGGGPLGGVDIGAVTGAAPGDIARSNGLTGAEDGFYILKSTGVWQALHDPTETHTPV